jgi:hypothetical protein
LSFGCARQNSLTGGERDTTPPQVLEYDPPNLSTNFESKQFEIEFDEYVQIKNLADQLIISPFLEEPPEYSLRGKRLILEWEDELQTNTTYQFNFGSAVVDLTENNPKSDLLYVFSTGDLIDSLTIEGNVFKAIDNEPLSKASVMLYRDDLDSLPLTMPPDFFALSDEDGNFKLRYLPEGAFKLFVLYEESPNYLYDGPPEIIGFPDSLIASGQNDSTAQFISIPTFTEEDTTQFITGTVKKDYGYYQTTFNLPATNPQISFTISETDIVIPALNLLNEDRDTLTSWLPLYLRDEPIEEIVVITSDGVDIQDTTFWYPEIDPKFREEPKLTLSSNLSQKKLDRFEEIKIKLSNPLEELDTTLVEIYEDSVRIDPLYFRKAKSGLHFTVHINKNQESIYQIILREGAVKDLYGLYNDSTALSFQLEDEEYYGNLNVIINDSLLTDEVGTLIYEFTDGGGKAIITEALAGRELLQFKKLNPGKYGLRLLLDENGNQEWDSGSYADKRQPEKRMFYPEEIEIRSNWELEIDWTPAPKTYGFISK